MFSFDETNITFRKGNILSSTTHARVNTVNCVGVMGKGIALAFKRRYPEMFRDYVRRCDKGEVRLGEPYPYDVGDHIVVNFPTKQHWRSLSRLDDIETGLMYLKEMLPQWGIRSIALPPVGCGNGQLDWAVVRPTLVRHLAAFGVPVELYVPHDVNLEEAQMSLLDDIDGSDRAELPRTEPAHFALVEILDRLEKNDFHWPVGRVFFQKIAYFATVAGIPTGLQHHAADFGPFSPQLKRATATLQNNGLVAERHRGNMFEVRVGPTFGDLDKKLMTSEWSKHIDRVVNLMARFNTTEAEAAATAHYVYQVLRDRHGRRPTTTEIMEAAAKWKIRRDPPMSIDDVGQAIVTLAARDWIEVEADQAIDKYLDELVSS